MGSLPWSNISVSSSSENHTQQVYPEIHILHEKNQVRKKWKEWKNIEKILETISKKYNVGAIHDNSSREIFMNMFEYFSLCYNLQFEERPVYQELYHVLQK
jgi:hypothetical protein